MNIRFNDREKKIISCIEEITGITPSIAKQQELQKDQHVESYHINNILLLSSSYHFFQLEEEGRLSSLLQENYMSYGREDPPQLTHVESQEECLSLLANQQFDLVIIFDKLDDVDSFSLATQIKSFTNIPIVLLGNNIAELIKIEEKNTENIFSKILTWNGDGKIILAIIQLIEDSVNIQKDSALAANGRCVVLIEDSIQYYSTYLFLLYDEIHGFLESILSDSLTEEQRTLRLNHRPVLLHAQDFDTGVKLYQAYKNNIIGIITDNQLGRGSKKAAHAGEDLIKIIQKEKPDIPILIQSSEPYTNDVPRKSRLRFVSKNDATLALIIKDFINECLGPREIILKDANQKELYRIKNIKNLEDAVLSVDDTILSQAAIHHLFSTWIRVRGENDLAENIQKTEKEVKKSADLRKRLIDLLEENKYTQTQASVTPFERTSLASYLEISRIGKGALGGKARGLSFLAKLVSKYISDDMFPNLRITIPRTLVISTDIFESFLAQNSLPNEELFNLPDERIALKFMSASLPATVLGDLRAFIHNTRKPLVVRSSGVLEDSLLQSFAGIYDSILLPNESWETDFRFQDVCNAVKYVYASTFFEKARTYIKSTPKNIGDEKMAVIIQEVVGRKHETYFYPAISGVAKSYNYYPSGDCKQEEGIVYLALGLGKAIVDGGSTFGFCPERPTVPLFGTPKDFMRYSQRKFYALNLKSVYRIVERNEETSYSILEVNDARRHGMLDKIASTYVRQDDSLYPGVYEEGSLVIDFGPITQYDAIPLAKALKLLLRISEITLGYPVEIEFAVNLGQTDSERAELVILQIRSMVPPGKTSDIIIGDFNAETDICYSENALGNGILDIIQDIIYIKPCFTMSNSAQVVSHLRSLNTKLMEEKKPYMLIGPGRWGSADPWLGIPVIWSDIAGVKIIIETPFKERTIDPSQGSHFFHDLISSQVGYIITKEDKGNINMDWLENLPTIEEMQDVKHVRLPEPLEVQIDGKHGKAVIRKKKNNE
jgi:Pyruvate phosphate dikinase, AMP/ATP-binding domain